MSKAGLSPHGALISKYLADSGQFQYELAVKIGVTPSMVSYWISGKRMVSVETAVKLECISGKALKREYFYPELFGGQG